MKINILLLAASLISLTACHRNNHTDTKTANISIDTSEARAYSLIGKKGLLVYPVFKAEVDYLSDSTLHWKTTTPDGKINEGTENVFLKKLNDTQYFLNWIEQDGLSISQVIDLKAHTVTAYGTYADEKSPRGKRSSMTLEGTFEFIK